MRIPKLVLPVCMKRKRIRLPHVLIQTLGNPTHLCFFFDEVHGRLIVTAAEKDDLDAFEIPAHYWKNKRQSCELSRIAFLTALQYRFGWEGGKKYSFGGEMVRFKNRTALVFHLNNGHCGVDAPKSSAPGI